MNDEFDFRPETPQGSDGNGMSIASLVLGILSMLCTCFPFVPLIFGILGIIFAVCGRKKSTLCYGKPSGLAVGGLVLSIIGTIFASISTVLFFLRLSLLAMWML